MSPSVDIQIPDIEKELDKLWKAADDKSRQKACLFTLIIYASDPRRAQYLQELVDTILDKFPCRIIFIKVEISSTKPNFHVEVSTVLIGNVKQKSTIACDQISIEASPDQLFRVPFLVTPHVIPDLPVYLLWGQNPFEENIIFPSLQPLASRVVFDSECSDNLNNFCKEMLDNLQTLKIDVVDINWALISNWRDMLFELFSTPEKVAELQRCKSLTIHYNRSATERVQHPEIRAIYLQGWLASQLQWKSRKITTSSEQMTLLYDGPNNPIEVILIPGNYKDLPSGGISSLEILLTDGNSYFINRKPNISQVVVHASSTIECQLPFTLPLPNIHRGLTFIKEIFYSKPSLHYRDMLKTISKINFKS